MPSCLVPARRLVQAEMGVRAGPRPLYSPPEPRSEASSSAGFRPGNFFQLFALPSRGVFPESPPQTPSSPLPFTPSPFFARGIGHRGGPARTGQDRPQPRPQRPP